MTAQEIRRATLVLDLQGGGQLRAELSTAPVNLALADVLARGVAEKLAWQNGVQLWSLELPPHEAGVYASSQAGRHWVRPAAECATQNHAHREHPVMLADGGSIWCPGLGLRGGHELEQCKGAIYSHEAGPPQQCTGDVGHRGECMP